VLVGGNVVVVLAALGAKVEVVAVELVCSGASGQALHEAVGALENQAWLSYSEASQVPAQGLATEVLHCTASTGTEP